MNHNKEAFVGFLLTCLAWCIHNADKVIGGVTMLLILFVWMMKALHEYRHRND